MNTCKQCGQPMASNAPEGLCARCLLSAAVKTDAPEPVTRLTPAPDFPDIADMAEVARRLPQFEILSLLGRGGMGVVYQARQVQLDRVVALKILPLAEAMEPDFVERFRREARSLAKLSHPNIVHVYDFGETGGLYYFVMEFIDGVNLRDMIRSGKMKPAEALAVVPKICDALQFAHEEGVVHRDIKPENILIDKRGRVKIADFGLAKLLRREQTDHTLTQSGMTLGTPRYMAPEQMDKPESVDHRADIYSLGVVFYEMLTGEVPMGRFAPPSERVQVDVRLDEIVLRSLERDVARRYQHASEVRDDVEKVTSKPAVAATPSSQEVPAALPPQPASARFLRSLLWLAVIVGAVMFLWFDVITLHGSNARTTIRVGAVQPWLVLGDRLSSYAPNLLTVSGLAGLGALIMGIALFCFRLRSAPDVRREVRRAAVGLLISGIAGAVNAFAFTMMVINEGQWDKRLAGCLVGVAVSLTFAVLAVLIFRGAMKMLHCEDHAASRLAALCSIFSFNIVSLPIGIWALVRLSRPEVKALFIPAPVREDEAPNQPPAAKSRRRRLLVVAVVSAATVAISHFVLPSNGAFRNPFAGLGGADFEVRSDRSQIPMNTTPGREDYAFTFKCAPDHAIEMWLEFWRDGRVEVETGFSDRVTTKAGVPFSGTLRLTMMDGDVASVESAGKTRFDWQLDYESKAPGWSRDASKSSAKNGTWRPNQLKAAFSRTSTWDEARDFHPKPGETVTLLALCGFTPPAREISTHEMAWDETTLRKGWPTTAIILRARFVPVKPGELVPVHKKAAISAKEAEATFAAPGK